MSKNNKNIVYKFPPNNNNQKNKKKNKPKVVVKINEKQSIKKNSSQGNNPVLNVRVLPEGAFKGAKSMVRGPFNPRPINSTRILQKFIGDIIDPFSPNSIGCRVPDPYSFPTATYHVSANTVVGGALGGSYTFQSGQGTLLFMPNPVVSLFDISGSNTASQGAGFSSSSVYTTGLSQMLTGADPSLAATNLYAAADISVITTLASSYRVVSWGIRISNLQPEISATGRVIMAYVPMTDTVPNIENLKSAHGSGGSSFSSGPDGTSYLTQSLTGSTDLDTTEILNFNTAQECAVQDFLHGDAMISGRYINPSFWNFKSTVGLGNTNGTNAFEADDIVFAPGGGVYGDQSGFKDPTRMSGACGILVHYEGMPGTGPLFEVQTIYHLEVVPPLTTNSSQSIPVPSVNALEVTVGHSNIVEAAMNVTSNEASTMRWVDSGLSFLSDHKDSIYNTVSTVGEMAKWAGLFLA